MTTYHRLSMLLSLLSVLFVLAACGNGTTASSGNAPVSGSLQNVSIGLGYNPDIQFAPFYVAQSKGYYKAAGLNVTFNHGIETDLFGSMLVGHNTFVFAGGDELLVARDKNKNVNVIDVANVFQQYPVGLIVPADSPIKTLADLKGHSIGEPGAYGATHTGLLALLQKAGLTLNDVHTQAVGFNQVPALMAHRVDAVVGYTNNEPLQLERDGFHVRTFAVSDYLPLVSNGIITTQQTYQSQPQVVRGFVQATLKGLRDVIADPQAAVTISKNYIPGLNTAQALEVLQATVPIYKGNGRIGYNDSATWQATEQFLVAQKMIAPVDNLTQVYTNQALA